jgi:cytochrome c553
MAGFLAALWLLVQADPQQFFEEKIRPLLAARCWGCHGDAKVSGLRLDSLPGMLAGGRLGPALKPGDARASLLIEAVRREHPRLKMPPDGRLDDAEIAALEQWIQSGAPWPETTASLNVRGDRRITPNDRNWWAFRPLQKPPGNIDSLVHARHRELGLSPAPPADRRTLIRRLSIDLTGLPPSPELVDEFLRHGNLPQLVDRLLASPRFGERWARYWLDVARYAEDDVLGLSQEKYPNAWRYRDWVVQALNRDLPYDIFVKAQLAADQLPGDYGIDLRPALGLLGLGPWHYTISPPPQARADERHDRIDVVTRGLLGLTVGCARCHDHKFDPISMKDYYALAGVFGSTEYREYPLAPPDVVDRWERHQQQIRDKEKAIKEWLEKKQEQAQDLAASRLAETIRRGDPKWTAYLARPDRDQRLLDHLTPEQAQEFVLELRAEKKQLDEEKRLAVERSRPPKTSKTRLPNGFELYDDFCPGCDVVVRSLDRDRFVLWQDLFREPAKDQPAGVLWVAEADLPDQHELARLRHELEQLKATAPPPYPFLHGVADKERVSNLRVALKGDPYRLGEEAPRRFLEVLSPEEPEIWQRRSGRLELAEAILKQPLAARVAANRIWMHLFGRGIVGSPSNFGRFGERPSNPPLLEYLAARLIEHQWSIKALIREIVLSATYQRSSSRVASSDAIDAENKHFWRANRRRLDAEALRDALLAASGNLEQSLGGPSEDIAPDSRRRTLYARISRFQLNPTLSLFDFPTPSITAEKRVVTHVPLQRLFFLNNDFVTRQAQALAARSRADVKAAYRILFGRLPTKEERHLAKQFLRDSSWEDYARVLLTSNEFLFLD